MSEDAIDLGEVLSDDDWTTVEQLMWNDCVQTYEHKVNQCDCSSQDLFWVDTVEYLE